MTANIFYEKQMEGLSLFPCFFLSGVNSYLWWQVWEKDKNPRQQSRGKCMPTPKREIITHLRLEVRDNQWWKSLFPPAGQCPALLYWHFPIGVCQVSLLEDEWPNSRELLVSSTLCNKSSLASLLRLQSRALQVLKECIYVGVFVIHTHTPLALYLHIRANS